MKKSVRLDKAQGDRRQDTDMYLISKVELKNNEKIMAG